MQFQKILWIPERVTVCHAEPQRSISTPNATDPSLRLRVTREGPLSKSVLLCETALSAMYAIMRIDYELRTSSYPPMKAEKSVPTIVWFHVFLA